MELVPVCGHLADPKGTLRLAVKGAAPSEKRVCRCMSSLDQEVRQS